MSNRTLVMLLGALALTFAGGTALAQTPDTVTPAEEEVCNQYKGTSRLFGLCNSYCEALDCDGTDVPEGARHPNPKACLRIADQFYRQSGYVAIEPTACGAATGPNPNCFFDLFLAQDACIADYDTCLASGGETNCTEAFNLCIEATERANAC